MHQELPQSLEKLYNCVVYMYTIQLCLHNNVLADLLRPIVSTVVPAPLLHPRMTCQDWRHAICPGFVGRTADKQWLAFLVHWDPLLLVPPSVSLLTLAAFPCHAKHTEIHVVMILRVHYYLDSCLKDWHVYRSHNVMSIPRSILYYELKL